MHATTTAVWAKGVATGVTTGEENALQRAEDGLWKSCNRSKGAAAAVFDACVRAVAKTEAVLEQCLSQTPAQKLNATPPKKAGLCAKNWALCKKNEATNSKRRSKT